jgi:carbonic anhydrase
MPQSPIRLETESALPLCKPDRLFECKYLPETSVQGCFDDKPGEGNFLIKGGSATIVFRGCEYELKKIHMHGGSEHMLDKDDPHDMELHFVHAPKGSPVASPLVAIGVLFRVSGKESMHLDLEATVKRMVESAQLKTCIELKPLTLFPVDATHASQTKDWFHYEGSLTSFPYTENVSWIVMKSSAYLSQEDLDPWIKHAEQPQRGLQPLDRRLVVRSF